MLVNTLIDNIKKNDSVRQNLIELKTVIKDANQKKALAYHLAGDFSVFTELLSHEDPKVRKNAVLILGEMECDDLADAIWEGYCKEQTLFVKSDYLKSLGEYDCKKMLHQLKERMAFLTSQNILPEEEKHLRSEIAALHNLIVKYDDKPKRKFTGYQKQQTIILLTNRNHRDITRNQLSEDEVKYLAGGIRLQTERLEEIKEIRTFSELLFPLPGLSFVEGTMEQMAKKIAQGVLTFLKDNHTGTAPYYFRLELKGIANREQKTQMMKKFSIQIEKASGRALMNATTGYEIEIRLIANKKEQYVPLLKLYTIPDVRFSYRKEVLPTSIAPVNAALIMELAKEHLTEGAQVLDPFCGTGTMLIERCKLLKCGSIYGLDILEEAIDKARINTDQAHLPIHYINRDYFDFKHDYLFDEIVTNLPVIGKTRSRDDIEELYERFLQKSASVLQESATLIVYTTMPEVLQECIKKNRFYRIVDEYVLNEREGGICFAIGFKK